MRDVALRRVEDGWALDADFAFELTPRLAEVVANGVPLYFSVEFELTRRRWYWFDETAAAQRLQLRLSYHALSRQYRCRRAAAAELSTLDEALTCSSAAQLAGDGRTALFSDRTTTRRAHALEPRCFPNPFQLSR